MSAENITPGNLNDFIVAYVDGELSAAEMSRVETLLADDPKARQLRDTLRRQGEALKGLHRGVVEQPAPADLIAAIRSAARDGSDQASPDVSSPGFSSPGFSSPGPSSSGPSSAEIRRPAAVVSSPGAKPQGSRTRLWLVAASVAFLVVGAAGGFVAGERYGVVPAAQNDWLMQVAQYHGIYAREKRHLVEVSADETPHIESWLGNRLGRTLTVPDLSASGAEFKGARLLGINGKPVAQLIYQIPGGEPFALCLMPSGKGDLAPVTAQRADLNMVEWRQGGYAFVVVGWEEETALQSFVDPVRETLDL